MALTTPTSTSELNQFNQRLRQSKTYQEYLAKKGYTPGQSVKLSPAERRELQDALEAKGIMFQDGIEIDPAGNVNQNEGFTKQLKTWGPVAAGLGITALGIPGLGKGLLNRGANTPDQNIVGKGVSTLGTVRNGLGETGSGGDALSAIRQALGLGGTAGQGSQSKSVLGKLTDTLTSPGTITTGLGAVLAMLGGDDQAEDPRLDPARIARQDSLKDAMLNLSLTRLEQPKTFSAVPSLNFSPTIPGLPFKLQDMFQGTGLDARTKAPSESTTAALQNMRKLLGPAATGADPWEGI